MDKKAIIYHLYHSGVAVEIGNKLLIFDYYNDKTDGEERSLRTGVINPDELSKYKEIFIFVTHSHYDHYNPVIFEWEEYSSNISYILSFDIDIELKENYYSLDTYEELNLKDIYIKAYGTTDRGLSYYVEVGGVNIFHTGDLNWWHWKKFDKEKQKIEERDYKREIGYLVGKEIDIAFVPVDPRLEEYYYLAGEYFIETVGTRFFVPIHFADNFHITEEFANRIGDRKTEVVKISRRGERRGLSSDE